MNPLRRLPKDIFNFLSRGIFSTPPARCDPDGGYVLLSQTYHADVTMFLVAAKSFMRFSPPRRVVVVDDGLTDGDRAIIQEHVENVSFIRTTDVDTGLCPKRGTWERLVTISHLCGEDYVVQLDSDTITIRRPTEVLDAMGANRSFALGTDQGRRIIPLKEASIFARQFDSTHVQILAEQAMNRIPSEVGQWYVRACSGFAGFCRAGTDFLRLERFSNHMSDELGMDVWQKWGSEQVASNFLISNTGNPCVLQLEQYPYWAPGRSLADARFVHFIGSGRFKGGEYGRRAREAIRSMAEKR